MKLFVVVVAVAVVVVVLSVLFWAGGGPVSFRAVKGEGGPVSFGVGCETVRRRRRRRRRRAVCFCFGRAGGQSASGL